MLRWIANWAARYAPTVEQQAQKALPELRLELFQAEQRILDAQVHADYYRARLAFCESVLKNGIEQVSDKRKEPETAVATLRSGPKLYVLIMPVFVVFLFSVRSSGCRSPGCSMSSSVPSTGPDEGRRLRSLPALPERCTLKPFPACQRRSARPPTKGRSRTSPCRTPRPAAKPPGAGPSVSTIPTASLRPRSPASGG